MVVNIFKKLFANSTLLCCSKCQQQKKKHEINKTITDSILVD